MAFAIVLGVIGVIIATDLQASSRTPLFDLTHCCPGELVRVTARTANNHRGVIPFIGIRLATLVLPPHVALDRQPAAPGTP